ncbi:MAG TPA: GMC family oxidoreductase [Polyangiaceae bacterium]|jgi:cholesterol oxidase|nr:GMC family oxidoreductase [Polyangiaceae bacterium]
MPSSASSASHYDWIIVGSGFGGSVSALRLAEKGYRVLVLEKGRRFAADDFPRTNWDLPRWMWRPSLGLRGIFQMSFFRHVTVLHGVGVGGGSLVYANTLAYPTASFFASRSWSASASAGWETELEPHYATARRMLGAARNPRETPGDRVLLEIARESGRENDFRPADVAVYFGAPGETARDPFFGGAGPDRAGCTFCGACMTGCRVGAKNTLDRNYLYLAEKRGAEVRAETEVIALRARPGGGYVVEAKDTFGGYGTRRRLTADRVVCAGGVMGTVPLLLAMREDPEGLPRLSPRVGDFVRTNSEALFAVVAPDRDDLSNGIAITSILHTDDHSHLEPVRYGAGSGFFRLLALPYAPGKTSLARIAGAIAKLARNPRLWARALSVRDFARHTQILLYMRTLESNLSLRLGRSVFTGFTRGLVTRLDPPAEAPQAFMPDATALAERFAKKVGGAPLALVTDMLLGTPSTAHILGGACMGASAEDGVIDGRHRAFGYEGLYVIDGSSVSANPGVNPSLTITALAERAMSFVPAKS